MKRHLCALFSVVLLFGLAAWSQSSSPDSSGPGASAQAGSSSGPTGSMASQAGSQAASDTEQMMEGCIIREQSDYFLEPINGQEVHLSGPDVAQHVNHHVRVHGNEQPSQASNSTGTAGSMAGSSSSAGNSAPEFLVTRVDMVSESCPANLQHRPSASQAPGTTPNDQSEPK